MSQPPPSLSRGSPSALGHQHKLGTRTGTACQSCYPFPSTLLLLTSRAPAASTLLLPLSWAEK